jgi:succinate dehydrogenase/fumarate reductase flavoprotein subunit
MSEKKSKLSRRKFMAVSSAAIAAPIVMNMAGRVPEVKGAEKTYDFVDKKSCDLIVLGGGGSGLIAAVRAAQLTGKKVIVLEKSSVVGGAALAAHTIRTFRSKWQTKRNLPDTFAEFANTMMDTVYWALDPKLVSNCLLGTGQFFDWVCELKGGDIESKFTEGKYSMSDLECEPIGPQVEGQVDGKTCGGLIMSIIAEKCKTFGVEVLTKHPVADIELENGRIVAAIAKSDKGYVRIACKACILSTGSWIKNDEIRKKYAPEYDAVKEETMMGAQDWNMGQAGHANSNYTGDGISLAEKVGSFVDYNSFCIRLMGPMGMGSMNASPYAITVNLDGNRFCSEPVLHLGTFDGGFLQAMQPHASTYNVFDQNAVAAQIEFQKCVKAGKCQAIKSPPATVMGPLMTLPDTLEEALSSLKSGGMGGGMGGAPGSQSGQGGAQGGMGGAPAGMAAAPGGMGGGPGGQGGSPGEMKGGQGSGGMGGGGTITADTLEELADKMGVNKKNFLETVKRYNEACETGCDLEMFKNRKYLVPLNKPPFFAAKFGYNHDGAFGGVRVNPDMQAYKADRKNLVEGFYVTGDFATGRHLAVNGRKRQVLNDLSWAFSSGFLAGTNVAKYLKGV